MAKQNSATYEKIQIKLNESQRERLKEIHLRAIERAKGFKIDLAYVGRRIAGFAEPDEFVTQKDIDYFHGKNIATLHRVIDLGTGTSDLKAESEKAKKPNKKVVNGD